MDTTAADLVRNRLQDAFPDLRLPRPIIGYATYSGDHTHLAGQVTPMGPSYDGEYRWPVTAVYDPETKRTRVGFTHIPHPEAALA
jgi:hypothetical protein